MQTMQGSRTKVPRNLIIEGESLPVGLDGGGSFLCPCPNGVDLDASDFFFFFFFFDKKVEEFH